MPTTAPQAALPAPGVTPTGGGGGQLAFASNPDDNWDLYLLDIEALLAGQSQAAATMRLTTDPGHDWAPVWSPDGRRLAFYSDRDGNNEIYVLSPGAGAPLRLTHSPTYDADPAWSPDGQRLVFVSDRDGNPELYTMLADGTALVRLTDHPAADGLPAWSPDGRQIAFISDRDGNAELYVMAVGGDAEPLRLTFHTDDDISPAWSPDGQWLAFVSNRNGSADIYVLNIGVALAAGVPPSVLRVTNTEVHEWSPAWSPDGQWLVFSTETENGAELYALPVPTAIARQPVISPQNRSPVWLTDNELIDFDPDWRP